MFLYHKCVLPSCTCLHSLVHALLCRLGHKVQKDEWIPRLVEVFQRGNIIPPTAVVAAGSAYSAASAGNSFQNINMLIEISLDFPLCARVWKKRLLYTTSNHQNQSVQSLW